MFESMGRMFGYNKTGDSTSSPKRSRYKEDFSISYHNENSHELNVDDSNIILQRIKQLHLEQLMTDVTLVIEGKEFPAHRLILCASSDVFQVMLMKPEWTEWHESRIILQEPQQCIAVFHLFLGYFYSGQITLKHDNVMPILALADKYNVKNLATICVSYMCSNIAQAATHNHLISWLQYTLACGHTEVSKNCQNFVKWNFESIAKTEDFGNFDTDVFISLLQQNDLVVENEITLYDCAVKWLERQKEHCKLEYESDIEVENQMKSLTEQIMVYIRFPMMTPAQLAKLLLSPLINKYKEFFVERMAIGMIYHSGQEERVLDICGNENDRFLFTPRLYTSDNFSSTLIIENFTSLPSYETRGFMFPTHMNLAEYKGEYICDWMVDLYPKGVWFKKFYLIVWQGTVEVPEHVIPSVRLAVTCKDNEAHRVKISILIFGEKAGIEYVVNVIERIHTFSNDDKLLNIENVIPFEEINPRASSENTSDTLNNNLYLIGSLRNTLKLHIIITPLTEFCSNSSPNFILK